MVNFKKKNCWEFHKCGREQKRCQVAENDVCPAAQEKRLNGVHGGKNGGRACWVVAGTFCGGLVQGSFAQKVGVCSECEFYKLVLREDFQNFEINQMLKKRMACPVSKKTRKKVA
jgi:hypothetical protein